MRTGVGWHLSPVKRIGAWGQEAGAGGVGQVPPLLSLAPCAAGLHRVPHLSAYLWPTGQHCLWLQRPGERGPYQLWPGKGDVHGMGRSQESEAVACSGPLHFEVSHRPRGHACLGLPWTPAGSLGLLCSGSTPRVVSSGLRPHSQVLWLLPSRDELKAQAPTPSGAPHQADPMGGPLRPATQQGLGPAVSPSRGRLHCGGDLSEGLSIEKPQIWGGGGAPGQSPRS